MFFRSRKTTAGDPRDEFIKRVVPGKTFADLGGLWGTVNEKVSVAHSHGASDVSMWDIQTPESPLWDKFKDRMQEKGVANFRCSTIDLGDEKVHEKVAPAEVVHCSGVLYHHPHPMLLLQNLRKLTKEYAVLTSAVARERIRNRRGSFKLPPSGVLFVPALNESERAVLKAHWEPSGAVLGITEPCEFKIDDFAPWWWLATPKALLAMCKAAGFKVEDSALTWNNNAFTVLLSC